MAVEPIPAAYCISYETGKSVSVTAMANDLLVLWVKHHGEASIETGLAMSRPCAQALYDLLHAHGLRPHKRIKTRKGK